MTNVTNFKPFLGKYNHKDGMYVVAFYEPDAGLVVLSENPNIKFFQHGDFDMTLFEPLGPGEVVHLSNYDMGLFESLAPGKVTHVSNPPR